jgi:hypothetical protein
MRRCSYGSGPWTSQVRKVTLSDVECPEQCCPLIAEQGLWEHHTVFLREDRKEKRGTRTLSSWTAPYSLIVVVLFLCCELYLDYFLVLVILPKAGNTNDKKELTFIYRMWLKYQPQEHWDIAAEALSKRC